ncbi:protein SLOW GREEN 1, chloroplastic [Beta vulgaris subsp. vulgaris]|uniref:protein SLOW GREEN 1, chloroplastic n=1 Tax=Beta vulgaris subsp. vulgaris TaxID=3555 RepID=UPI0020366982|nr:protein SLOW GREEN 1, chloroplastic [Beta vulgaris subsp. vulgaris]
MESLTKLNYKQPQHSLTFSLRYHNRPSFSTPISSISFKTQFSRPFPLKIRSSSSSNSPLKSSTKPKTENPFSLLKTPLTIAVASTAIFFSVFGQKHHSAARAEPTSPAMVEEREEEDVVSNEEREKKVEEFLASNPDDVEGLKSLMEAKIKNKKLGEAVEVLNRLIELEPDDGEWPLLRCHMYSYMGESEMAKSGFEEIIAKEPLRVEAFHGLVMAVSQGEKGGKELEEVTKRTVEAMERCRREKKNDEMRDFKLLIAQIRVIEGNYMEALKVYQELVKDEPRDFRPYLCQGIIYTLLRKKDEAQKQFDKYKRLVPKGHPYARFFDENMLATKVFSQMAENERTKMGSQN